MEKIESWDVSKADRFYNINSWGLGYFEVSENGNLCVKPSADSAERIDLKLLVDELLQRNIQPPILIRFMDILRDRMHKLSGSFLKAMRENDYKGGYVPLFPIKVNQERDVVTSFLRYGGDMGVGLEAGSKAELMIVLSLTQFKDTPIICNGYKDPEFVNLVCMAHKIGKRIFPVIENYSEVEYFIKRYKEIGIMPNLGVRVKLATRGVGQWSKTAGDASKFGLRIPELVRLVDRLKEEGLLDSLKLLHFHIGSQISQIKVVKKAIVETMRVFTELAKLGAHLEYLDIGGGLGVDYEGNSTESAVNYTLDEYASDVVYRIKQLCDENGIKHPTIFSESGRFLAAHYSILVTNVPAKSSVSGDGQIEPPPEKFGPVREMYEILESIGPQSPPSKYAEAYHDAMQYKSEALDMFNLGYLSLPERANMERVFWRIMKGLSKHSDLLSSDEQVELEKRLADTYFANFSLFQSLPDSWAIDQLFPVIPIHRLDEAPSHDGVIVDLTCDSDGLIESYVNQDMVGSSVPLHDLKEGEPYYIGVFLVGAYQETLGELHNLFGDPHAVQVEIIGDNRYKIRNLIKGDTINDVISYVSYDPSKLVRKMRDQIERAVEEKLITIEESARYMRIFEEGMSGYTYFEEE